MKMISPSKLAIQASAHQGFKPIGIPAEKAGVCMMCGFPHAEGELVVSSSLSSTFTNWGDLANNSDIVCGYCAAVSQDPWTQAWMSSVITESGVYKFASNNDIAFWLLNPPNAPFIMMRGDQKTQHLVWRTPVNYSPDVYQVRFGEKMLIIRRKQLILARDAALRLSARIADGSSKKSAAKSFHTPFVKPVRDMDSLIAGQLRPQIVAIGNDEPAVAADLHIINQCTPGEIWALTAVLYAEPIAAPTLQELKIKSN
jgi:CRISPR type IV-associated protein Csf1